MNLLEQWRDIPGHPEYQASDQGRVRSFKPWRSTPVPRVLRMPLSHGYPSVRIGRGAGEWATVYVHKLVMLAFVGRRPSGLEVRHLDGNQQNGALANLAYGTKRENSLDTVRHGTCHWANRTHCPDGHAYTSDNTYVDPAGSRRCVTCIRRQQREWKRDHRVAVSS